MTEYISREAAIAEMNAEGYTKNMRVHKRILAIPTADVVPVVRCKDCICFHPIGTSKHNGDCDKHYERVQCDDYCSWAEVEQDG